MIRNTLRNNPLHGSWLRGFAAALALLATPAAAGADPFTLYGQVFQVDPRLAADESIADADLPMGPHVPFVQLQVVDRDTGVTRGAPVFAGANGNFTARFDAPAGSTVAIQVFRSIDDTSSGEREVRIYPEARKDINTVSLTGPAMGVAVKVASDERLLLDPGGSFGAMSVGIIFTQVGLVEIPYISQDLARPDKERIGLADFTQRPEGPGRAAAQNLPVFKDAPFGGLLHVFGAFGRVEPPCTGTIDWYRVKIQPVIFDGAGNPDYPIDCTVTDCTGSDLLEKMRFQIDYVPTFRADAFLEKLGPYDGEDLASAETIHNLYRVNPFPTTPGQTVVYSMADQRYSWATGGKPPGLYEISLEYFQNAPGGSDTHPNVVKIADSCFSPPEDAANVALLKLLVRIDNTPLTSGLDGLFVRTGGGGPRSFNYLEPGHLCDIIDLHGYSIPAPDDTIEIDFRARHNAGYLRSYSLSATSNAGLHIPFAADNYDNHSAGGPLWAGAGTAASPVVTAANTSPFSKCAYIFDLVVQGRAQNGYHYLHYTHHRQAYYVNPL